MKRFAIFTLVALLCSMLGFAETKTGKLEAFPGAEGYGRYTTGGRGGKVYKVTTLEDNNEPGSFRYACNQTGKRTIVFEVSGTIHLNSTLDLRNGNVTIAGQTAPGDGICITDYPFQIRANNVIIRFMRFRLGNKNATLGGADGWDALGALDQKDIIVDHCSVSWSLDECLSFGGVENTTVQWCIVANSLVHSGHSKGNHGYGGNWGGKHASYHHNLMANHTSRAPRLGPRPTTQMEEYMDMRNNVLFNYSGESCYGGEGMNVNIVNNYYQPGPGNKYVNGSDNKKYRIAGIGIRTNEYVTNSPAYAPALHKVGTYYVDGNKNHKFSDVLNDNWTYGMYNQIDWSDWDDLANTAAKREQLKKDMRLDLPIEFEYTTTHSVDDAYYNVYDYVGACRFKTASDRYVTRDAYDTAVLDDMAGNKASLGTGDEYDNNDNKTGKKMGAGFINTVDDITYPSKYKAGTDYDAATKLPILNSTAAPKDTDGDGMPDEWETANGLNPNDAADGAARSASGYTNLELYMNSLVQRIVDGGNAKGKMLNDQLTYADNAVELPVYDPSLDVEDPEPDTPDPGETTTEDITFSNYSIADNGAWVFNNGFKIITDKACSNGTSEDYIKYSRNVDFEVVCPDGKVATAVAFDGYSNDFNDANLSKVNGEDTSAEFIFPAKVRADASDTKGTMVYKQYSKTFSSPVSRFVFRAAGSQVGLKLTVTLANEGESGIEDIVIDTAKPEGNGKIYNIMGVEVKEPLLPGIYIRDGKKFLVK